MKHLSRFLFLMLICAVSMNAQITSAGSGNWNTGASWSTGNVPTATDNVVIGAGHTITIDTATAVCNNLTVNGAGVLKFRNSGLAAGISINGNLLINGNSTAGTLPGKLWTDSLVATSTSFAAHTLTLYGNLTVASGVDSSGILLLRAGSNALGSNVTAAVCNVTFAGTSNTVITLQKTTYSPNYELFNSITLNKTGGAKVVLSGGSLFMNNNSSVASSYLTFTSGMIETGASNVWAVTTSASAGVAGMSVTSYVNGNLGRGIASGGSSRTFEVGDANGYRPLKLYFTGSYVSKQYVVVRVLSGNANNGSSSLTGGIDKVSGVRYYRVSYVMSASTTTSASINRIDASYGADDGVTAGNTDLRVAYSSDNRATWGVFVGGTHTTAITASPTTITTTALTGSYPVISDGGTPTYVAIARATGTTTNTLQGATDVKENSITPSEYTLSQNYPNPFNPSTNFTYQVAQAGFVSVKLYDVLGREVATLVNEIKQAGTYPASWNATGFGSGIYFCKMQSGSFTETKKIILMK